MQLKGTKWYLYKSIFKVNQTEKNLPLFLSYYVPY